MHICCLPSLLKTTSLDRFFLKTAIDQLIRFFFLSGIKFIVKYLIDLKSNLNRH